MENGNEFEITKSIEKAAKKIFVFVNVFAFLIVFSLLLLLMDFSAISRGKFSVFYWMMAVCIDGAMMLFYGRFIGPVRAFEEDYSKGEGSLEPEALEKHWNSLTALPARLAIYAFGIMAVFIGGGGILLHLFGLFDLYQALIQLTSGVWVGSFAAVAAYAGSLKLIEKPLNFISETKLFVWGGPKITLARKAVALAVVAGLLPITIVALQLKRLGNEEMRDLYAESISNELKFKVDLMRKNWTPLDPQPAFLRESKDTFLMTERKTSEPKGRARLFSFDIAMPEYFIEEIDATYSLARRTNEIEWKRYTGKSSIISIMLTLLFGVTGVISAYVFGKLLAATVQRSASMTVEISKDNGFRYRMNTVFAEDETAEFGASVNILLDAVQKQFARTESLLDKVREAVAVLASSTAEMRAVADRQADDSHSQAGRVNDLAGTGSEIAAAAVEISHKSTSVKEAAEKTLESCREGMKRIESAVAQIGEANKRAEDMMNRMAGLEESFGEIEEIAGTISDVSDRTELLSLNAALEAAGAKKFGKRFAVVSSEVKRLAVRIGSMTSDIRGQLGDLRLALQETASATRESANAVEEGVKGVSSVQLNLDNLSRTAEKTYTSAIEINVSTRQQTMASERLAETLREISELASQVASGSEESRKAIEDISQIALSMNDLLWSSDSASE